MSRANIGTLNQQGYISFFILLIITFLVGAGYISCHKAQAQERMVDYEARKIQAVYLADSGLEWDRAALAANTNWAGGKMDFGGGEIEVSVIPSGSGYQVISKSKFGGAEQGRIALLTIDDEGQLIISVYEELYN